MTVPILLLNESENDNNNMDKKYAFLLKLGSPPIRFGMEENVFRIRWGFCYKFFNEVLICSIKASEVLSSAVFHVLTMLA